MCFSIYPPDNDTLKDREEQYPPPIYPLPTSNIVLILDVGIPYDKITFFHQDPKLESEPSDSTDGIYSTRRVIAKYWLNNKRLISIQDDGDSGEGTEKSEDTRLSFATPEGVQNQHVAGVLENLPVTLSDTENAITTAIRNFTYQDLFSVDYSFVYLTIKNPENFMHNSTLTINNKEYVLSTISIPVNREIPSYVFNHYCQIPVVVFDIHDLFTIANNFTLNFITNKNKLLFFREKLHFTAVSFMHHLNSKGHRLGIRNNYAAFMLLMIYIYRKDKKECVDFHEEFENIYSDLETDNRVSEKKQADWKKVIIKILAVGICIAIGAALGFFVTHLACLMLKAIISASAVTNISTVTSGIGGMITGYHGLRFFNKQFPKRPWEEAITYKEKRDKLLSASF